MKQETKNGVNLITLSDSAHSDKTLKSEDNTKQIKREDWINEAVRRFGDDPKKWKFKCVNCGNVQCIDDLEKLGVKNPENYVYFSCIGRFMKNSKGEIGNKKSPCNYTLGGLFNFTKLYVVDDKGEKHSVFEFADEIKNE